MNQSWKRSRRKEERGESTRWLASRLDRYNGRRGNGGILRGRQLGGFSLTGEYSKGKRRRRGGRGTLSE